MRLAEAENESSDETTASVADSTEGSSVSGTTTENDSTEERFRVDRRKLEQMLEANSTLDSEIETADYFFQRVMLETCTTITWPTKLKVGAKSKKDPHIKITGQPEAVQAAREKILECLDTKRNRVTLKMDVSFTDHSHIIGKGGRNIQAVMEETGCHIHFPDSNRNAVGEKSNQVSIAGQPNGVNEAKTRIRELLPLVVSFDLPIEQTMGCYYHQAPDMSSPAIQIIQQTYNFTVTIKPKPRGSPITIVVRGCRRNISTIRQGLSILMGYFSGNAATVLPVSMSLEVPPQHHSFVMGRANSNVQNIMTETSTNIMFPDPVLIATAQASGPNNLINGLRKSTVVITGHFDGVYQAWQDLMGYLPLVLLFDLKEGQDLDTALVTSMMDRLDLNIVIRPKPKQNTKSILVRGYEKGSGLLFDVRHQLLELEQPEKPNSFSSDPPQSFVRNRQVEQPVMPQMEKPLSASLLKELAAFSQGNPLVMNNSAPLPPMQPSGGPFMSNNALLPWIMSQISTNPTGFYAALMQAQMVAAQQQQLSDMSIMGMLAKAFRDISRGPSPIEQGGSYSSSSGHASSMSSVENSPCESPDFVSSDGYAQSSAYGASSSSLSSTFTEQAQPKSSVSSWNSSYWLGENPEYSDVMSNQSPYEQNENVPVLDPKPQGRPITAGKLVTQASSMSSFNDQFKAVGSERRTSSLESDYIQKRLLASKAINEPVSGASRVPTDVWSGCGFSKSMPQNVFRAKLEQGGVIPKRSDTLPEVESGACAMSSNSWNQRQNRDFSEKDSSLFSVSNYLENTLPRPALGLNSSIQDLTHLLTLISLEQYLDIFRHQQVDLATFLTLNDQDLHELSIPYSARRRMLFAISELRNEQERHSRGFHAAPGAERRTMFSRQSATRSNSAALHTDW